MAYKALYRTYRPQTFEEVAGQKHIIRTLRNALATNKIAHAYLFCGPRGTGKTTMAKLFAKALNCEEGIGHQCNKCSNCLEVIEGSHPDVIEIDAASNNGVEQVRDLIDKVNYLPLKGKYKVYIIDEVHMMTTNAFNALLKTLEEPPAHVIFILATTEPHNIIPTILSRCQRYDFTKVSDGDIEERMMTILEKEGVQYDKEAIRAIISLADGGMRDALSILDQILAYSNNTLSVDDVYSIFGLLSTKEKVNLLKDINSGEVTRTLGKVKSFTEAGIDIKRLTEDLLEILKDVLIYKKTQDENELTKLSEQDASALADAISLHKIHEMIGAFLKLQLDFKTASNIKTMFEIALLKLLTSEEIKEVKPIQKQVGAQPAQAPAPAPTPEPNVEKPKPVVEQAPVAAQPQPKVETPIEDAKKAPDWLFDEDDQKKNVEADGARYELDDETIIKLMVVGDKELRHNIVARWDELDNYLGHPTLGDLVAILKDGTPFVATKNALILQYDFEKLASKVNVKVNSDRISDILKKMLGRDVFVYAVSRSESVRLLTAYQNLRQISKLPLPRNINIQLEDLRK
ncbi:MAG: DNA polymerase III subunit gamma/tau [Firmicutes bacterium]|nr:DNA polymerase III subunit gamma/tau [Candidatus Fiminaster equi]